MKKTRFAFVFSYFWLLLLFVVGLATLIFADKQERPSNTENRMLAGFPDSSAESIFSGKFSAGFESYLSDGIFLRDSIAGISESVLRIFNAASYEDTMLLESIAMADEISGSISAESESASSSVPEHPDSLPSQTHPEDEAGLFLCLPDGSTKLLSDVTRINIETVAHTLNAYKSFLPDDGHVFYSCVPVTNIRDVVVKSGEYTGWYESLPEDFAPLLVEGVHMVSAPNTLAPYLMDQALYFQADHHWTPLAAHYLLSEMLKIQGLPVVPYDEYSYKVNRFYNAQSGLSDPLELMYPLQDATGHSMLFQKEDTPAPVILYDYEIYTAYLGGGGHDRWTKYDTGFSTGRNALVIGDSFSTAFVPYLFPYYDTVHRVDPRYYSFEGNNGSISENIHHYGIDDIYIILSYDNGPDAPISTQTLESILYER